MNKFDWQIRKRFLNLQLFGDEASAASGAAEAETPENHNTDDEPGTNTKAEAKYIDADLDRIINSKFAAWQKQQEKKVSEAERLSKMTAEEKAAAQLKALEDKIHGYEVAAARAEMTKQARAILSDKGIHVDDALLANLIAEDADNTKAAVESFVSMFTAAVEKAVKEKVKGDTPKTGTSSGLTKDQILAITNRAERQQKIKENMHLFK